MTEQQQAEAYGAWRADRRERLIANLLAGRPAEFAGDGRLDARLAAWAGRLADGIGRNLILTGPVGVGKTWAVWHAAEAAVRGGYEGRVIITSAASLRRAFAPATADPAECARCRDAGLLVVDDLGSFGLSEWDRDNFGDLADARWSARLPTAVTSNTTDLRALLGPRISSRLAHNADVIEMDGPDRRRQQ